MTTGTAREALVAELLGDTERLLHRVDSTMPRLEAAAKRLEFVADRIPESTEGAARLFIESLRKSGESTAVTAVAVVNENAEAVFLAQTEQLKATAKVIFDEEVKPPLRQLTAELRAAIRESRNPWNRWLTHAATAAVAFCLPLPLVFWPPSSASGQERSSVDAQACAPSASASAPAVVPAAPALRPRARR